MMLKLGEKQIAYIFRDCVGVIYAVNALWHHNGFLLSGQSLRVVAHNVIQSRKHSKTLGDLGMHGPVNVV